MQVQIRVTFARATVFASFRLDRPVVETAILVVVRAVVRSFCLLVTSGTMPFVMVDRIRHANYPCQTFLPIFFRGKIVTLQEVLKYYGGVRNLAKELGVSTQVIYTWTDRPPLGRQYEIEVKTNGKLKADRHDKK